MKLSIIVAMDDNQLIGKDNTLPYHFTAFGLKAGIVTDYYITTLG
jgi:dihydrofolate reductase